MRTLLLAALLASPARAFHWWFGARAKSYWPAAPITLDADEGDWNQRVFDDVDGTTYGFANDADFLYMVFIPHTRMAKFQVSGGYRQAFTIWISPAPVIRKTAGFLAVSPGNGQPQALQPLGARPSLAGPALAALPEPDRRSVLEARIPLSAAGIEPGQTIAVGLEASPPDHWPAKPPVRQGQAPDRDEAFRPLRVWVRVRLAKPPR